MITLLDQKDKDNIAKWKYSVDDPSITTKYLTPFWDSLVPLIPDYVAPNVLSLAGLLLNVYSFYITYLYSNTNPKLVSFISALLLFTYQTLDAIDGKHARRIGNASPLGELFDHTCDSIGTVFLILTVAITLGITNTTILFYITQAGLILFLLEHLNALRTDKVVFSKYAGPGEILLYCIFVLTFKSVTGWSLIPNVISSVLFFGVYWLVYVYGLIYTAFKIEMNDMDEDYFNFLGTIIKNWTNDPHYGTKVGVLLCLFMRHINGILLWYDLISVWTIEDVIAHGLILSMTTSDLIVSKMAKRALHPIVVITSMLSVFNHNITIYLLVSMYYLTIFYELCEGLGLPLLTPAVNVYVSGVWDLLHLGHMKHFEFVSKLGNRLLVGVHDDIDVESYKRTPTLTMEERAISASHCKGVSNVIKSAPLVLTKDFINKHNIHKVVTSVEYDDPEDEYYRVPREMGILYIIDRIPGISTTDIMKRIKKE